MTAYKAYVSRLVLEAFRGVGKSWVAAGVVVWQLLRDPNYRWLVVSASSGRSDAFSIFCKQLINQIPLLQHLTARSHQRDSNVQFDVGPSDPAQAPSVKSTGIFGQLAGSRANGIIADDIEIPTNSDTPVKRDKLSEAIKEFDAVLSPDARSTPAWWREDEQIEDKYYPLFESFPVFLAYIWRHLRLPKPTKVQIDMANTLQEAIEVGNAIIYLGTPQSEDSIYNRLPERGYKMKVWPARYPDEEQLGNYKDRLAQLIRDELYGDKSLVGLSTDPERFTDYDLASRELSYGRSGFNLQFMLDTQLSDTNRYPLKLKDLIVTSVSPLKAPASVLWNGDPLRALWKDTPCDSLGDDALYRESWRDETYLDYQGGNIMYVDPSGRGEDETGYAVSCYLNGYIWVPAFGGVLGGYSDDALDKLLTVARDNDVSTIWIENNFGDGMFTKLLESRMQTSKIWTCKTEERRVNTMKEGRIISTLEPVMNQHKLIVDHTAFEEDFNNIPTKEVGYEKARQYRLSYQLTRIQKLRGCLVHDDRLDAFEGCVWVWTEKMNRDNNEMAKKAKEKEFLEEMKNTFGNTNAFGMNTRRRMSKKRRQANAQRVRSGKKVRFNN